MSQSSKKSFHSILTTFRKYSFSERDKGNKFEQLMQAYLQTDPKYSGKFTHVWLWASFPSKMDFGGKDTGIDLVAKTIEGDYWAIQCKCFAEDAIIDKPAVDTFLSTSGRSFTDAENGRTTHFSQRLWISTTNNWGGGADEAIKNQEPPVIRLNLSDLEEAPVDWEKLEKGILGEASRTKKKTPKEHQQLAVKSANEHYKTSDRGKLIMACGTGKTFTSLLIAENETGGKGLILFLVPSISLLGQALNEWYAEAQETINAICICSDPGVSRKKKDNDDSTIDSTVDLALPASTNIKSIVKQLNFFKRKEGKGLTVVFSTYQSIDVIAEAQKALLAEQSNTANPYGIFDLIICDEAHRTTGARISNEDESSFTKVHDNNILKAKRRLYMTATPRLYSDDAKAKAAQDDVILCSMDDESKYGKEFYRIGFGEAVKRDLLSDYKVLILTISENDMPASLQSAVKHKNEISTDDASKLIGCINALSKRLLGDNGILKETDPEPMRRAVAFCQKIVDSKKIAGAFNDTRNVYFESLPSEARENLVSVSARHIDGTMSAPTRADELSWLKSSIEDKHECRVLTNVKCLSEGVDVPALDAVLFLAARNSPIDVVQSVGRVMRTAPNKKYGYIIIPVVVPANVEPEKALDDNTRYKVVWDVLNALRAHDERFNATINKVDLNRKKPAEILIGRAEYSFEGDTAIAAESQVEYNKANELSKQIALQFEQLQGQLYARMVKKVGTRTYWEQWAKDVARIAEMHIDRINRLIKEDAKHRKAFDEFWSGLQKNINPSITEKEVVEMLAQHIITRPVFEALFEGYSFVKNNAISSSMQQMLDLLEDKINEKDTEVLNQFYDSVREKASGIDNSEGRQKIIIELYDKFFKTAFPKMVEKLGIVYTPVEVVDFIIKSVEVVLQKEFKRSISDENIHVLDPFTGTGTFITRLLQNGLIKPKDLERKYTHELHANEIVLLAYYIAAINIENAYHDLAANNEYKAFEGICLTDTFQLGETKEGENLISEMFPQNSARVQAQKRVPLRVIMGNPPYSVGQKSANDNAQNQKYDKLDNRIAETYAASTNATNKNSLYDSYIKAFRWSTDRLNEQNNGGVIAFVSNGAWIDGNATEGFRNCLEKEFSAIYVFNLRGNARTQGELRRKEAGNIFGIGSRTPISITILVKKPNNNKIAEIHYHDIGDYLNREEKLSIISKFGSIANADMKWQLIKPNEHGDWISLRNSEFENYIPIDCDVKYKPLSESYFLTFSRGTASSSDTWVYNYSEEHLKQNINRTIEHYNEQKEFINKGKQKEPVRDSTKGNWTRDWLNQLSKNKNFVEDASEYRVSMYRPFCKMNHYFDDDLNQERYQLPKLFPNASLPNFVICIPGPGGNKEMSALITNLTPDLHLNGDAQCFPLYYYEEQKKQGETLFDGAKEHIEYVRRDGITNFILEQARQIYGARVTKEDIFYYVYGLLHSHDYRTRYANDLKKMLPRIPLVDEPKDFWAFSKAGRKLTELHINYETVPPADGVVVKGAENGFFKVEKMRFPTKEDKSRINFNSKITIENIPAEAYEYIVNGKSAIEWIMERYQVTTNKDSGIKNDPNDWADEVGKPRYILDLLLSIIRVSIETMEIVKALPGLKEDVKVADSAGVE